jgi:hypothetical protein
LRSLSASASSKKLLRKLEAAIEKEIPALRRRIDFDNESKHDEPESTDQEPNAAAELSTEESED